MVANKIRFEQHFQQCSFHNPMLGGELDIQELEIRKDPLSGRQSVYNTGLKDKVKILFPPPDPALIERLARETEPGCFLCQDRWKQTTPTYPNELVPGGRMELGEAVLFPNLFPLSQVHAVIRVGLQHYLPLEAFSRQPIEQAFHVFRDFVGHLVDADPGLQFVTLNGNYLAPGGASIMHPHFQVLGSDVPFSHLEELLTLSTRYYEEHGTCYWTDLAEMEELVSLRTIARTGAVTWIASYAPRGSNEILGILPEGRNLLELAEQDLSDLAEGFTAVLRGYGTMGFSSFNFTLYSGPLSSRDDSFRCFLRIISRQNLHENYRADDYFLQKLLGTEIILTPPESLAVTLRGYFGG